MGNRVLDPAQLTRIEATHRGFGYQHLYAVACLLSMDATHTEAVVVEHDEDVELVRADSTVYVQVKTRERPLRPGDVDDVLARFDQLRHQHDSGVRPGAAAFVVVSNAEPGPVLRARLGQPSWPPDVAVLWPECPDGHPDLRLPTPWPDLHSALRDCVSRAGSVPFPGLAAETLVLKLAGLVQYLATGAAGHAITNEQVREHLEQVVVQLQEFPRPPENYRPQSSEPDAHAPGRVRMVVGVSGSGKTAWAARMAALAPSAATYFDVGELPGTALASSLARELVARHLDRDSTAIPTASGLELLALLSRRVREQGREITVVLDNVHRVSAGALRSILDAAADLRFVLLGRPWPGQAQIEAWFGVRGEGLGGWTLDDVAATFATAGCPTGVAQGQRVLGLTAGAPLYVHAAAQLAAHTYGADVGAFLAAVEARGAHVTTAQELILAESFDHLAPAARSTAGLLDLSDVPLTQSELVEIAGAIGLSGREVSASVRDLSRFGVVELVHRGEVKLHDAVRLLARDTRDAMPSSEVDAAREALATAVETSLPQRWTVGRFGLWVRLLALTDRLDTLIDIASQEQFHQVGTPNEVKTALESATTSTTLSAEERFWALDALFLWEYTDGDHERLSNLVASMVGLHQVEFGTRAHASLAMKQMITAALFGDRSEVEDAYVSGAIRTAEAPQHRRIVQYNYAMSLYHLGLHHDSASEAQDLAMDYYDHLGLERQDILGTSPAHILSVVPATETREDDFRHLADCLNLWALSLRNIGAPSALLSIHAMKFHSAAGAWRSAVKTGQDAADDLLALGDRQGARAICEDHLRPVVTTYELSDLFIPVRSQYAVILAWCGELTAAREEMARLEFYEVAGTHAEELENQRALIEEIATGHPM